MTTKLRTLTYARLALMGVVLSGPPAIVQGQDFASTNAAVISRVAVTKGAQRMAVRIEGAGHVEVHAARIQNPERLALDFPGARLKVEQRSIPGAASVRGVRMGQLRPNVARVVIDLTASVPYQIAHEGDAVVVYLQVAPADTNASAAAASTTSAEPQKQVATTAPTNTINTSDKSSNVATARSPLSNELTELPTRSATTNAAVISSVAIVQDAQRMAIRVEGAGHLDVHAARIQNPERLALDFAGARLNLPALGYVSKELQAILHMDDPRQPPKPSIPGVSAPVREVRMGQFRPDVARVVIDLTASVPYQIAHEGDAVVVYLQVAPADTNASAPTTSAEPQKQIAVVATTPPTNSINTSDNSSNAATACSPLSNELTELPASSATTNAAVISSVAITQDSQRTAVRIEGAGHVDVHCARIQNPERLALYFPGARLKVEQRSIPGAASVRGVRMGQFRPDVARVVIDLTASVPYQIAHEGDAVVVYLQVAPTDTNASAGAASTTSAEPQKQVATTPPTNSISTSDKSSNAATARSPLSNELTQPSH